MKPLLFTILFGVLFGVLFIVLFIVLSGKSCIPKIDNYQDVPDDIPANTTYNYNPDTEVKLKTVNYNVFGRWFNGAGYEGQDERLAAIPDAIAAHPKMGKDVDIITIDEAWCPDDQFVTGGVMCGSNKSRDLLIQSMTKNGWKYHTDVISSPGRSPVKQQTSGGSIIFSRWPIESTYGYVYDSAKSEDKHASKGVVYVRITITNSKGLKQVINVLGTHLQAWSTEEGVKAREGELNEIMNIFLPAVGIKGGGTEPLLFQGDMNTDYVQFPEEVDKMLNILHAKLPDWSNNEYVFTSDPSTNFLVGKDGAAKDNGCLLSYKSEINGTVTDKKLNCNNIPKTTKSGKPFRHFFTNSDGTLKVGRNCKAFCECCPHEMLDYILYSTDTKYLQPTYSDFEIIPLKSTKPLTYKWGWCEGGDCMFNKKESAPITGHDLSDHYPVVANFVFKPTTQTFIPPDGCKYDSDCTVKGFYCRCTGPGCTIDGKHISNGGGSHKNKVNDNCHWRVAALSKGTCFCRPGNN